MRYILYICCGVRLQLFYLICFENRPAIRQPRGYRRHIILDSFFNIVSECLFKYCRQDTTLPIIYYNFNLIYCYINIVDMFCLQFIVFYFIKTFITIYKANKYVLNWNNFCTNMINAKKNPSRVSSLLQVSYIFSHLSYSGTVYWISYIFIVQDILISN